jgi:hypothetical protein
MSRKLKRKEVDELEKTYGERKADTGLLAILRENYMRPLTSDLGQSLLNYRFEKTEQIKRYSSLKVQTFWAHSKLLHKFYIATCKKSVVSASFLFELTINVPNYNLFEHLALNL